MPPGAHCHLFRSYLFLLSVFSGCILAELIGRKPIFPGRDSFHQMTLICGVLGTPLPAELAATSHSVQQAAAAKLAGPSQNSANAAPAVSDAYISALPRKSKVPFRQLYPHASALACDLLDKLLVFEPEKRLTVEQALAHPYLDELHCEEDEPVCANFDYSDYYWEYFRTSKVSAPKQRQSRLVSLHCSILPFSFAFCVCVCLCAG